MDAMHQPDPLMLALIDLEKKIDDLRQENQESRDLFENHIKGEMHLLDLLKKAFPGDDPEGHRRYHEELIEQAKARKEFWRKMAFELAKWGLIGFLGWLFIQAWTGAIKGPQ